MIVIILLYVSYFIEVSSIKIADNISLTPVIKFFFE